MKNKIFLAAVAFSMPLASCSFQDLMFWKKKEEKQPEYQEKLTPAQKEQAGKVNTLLYSFIKETYGEETAESTKGYTVSYSEDIALYGVDADKVSEYFDEIVEEIEGEEYLQLAQTFSEMKFEGVLDDMVYYTVALGKSVLHAEALVNEEDGEIAAIFASFLDAEGNALPNNVYGIASAVVNAYNKATSTTMLLAVSNLYSDFANGNPIGGDDLKNALGQAGEVIECFLPTKDNAKYIVDLAKRAFSAGIAPFKEEEPFLPVLEEFINTLKFAEVIDSCYTGIEKFAGKLKNISPEYYTYLATIEDPIESIAYAVLGLLEDFGRGLEITADDVSDASELIISTAGAVIQLLEDLGAEVPELVNTILENENTKAILDKVVNLFVDSFNIRFESINAKTLAKVVPCIVSNPLLYGEGKGLAQYVYAYDDIPEWVFEEDFISKFWIEDAIECQSDREERCENEFKRSEPVYDEQTGVTSFTIYYVEDALVNVVGGEIVYTYVRYAIEEVEYTTLQPVVEFVYDAFAEIADNRATTSDIIAADIFDIIGSAFGLFYDIKDNFNLSELVLEIVDAAKVAVEEGNELFLDVVNDLFVYIKSALAGFLQTYDDETGDEIESTYPFTDTLVKILKYKLELGDIMFLFSDYEIVQNLNALFDDLVKFAEYFIGVEKVEEKLLKWGILSPYGECEVQPTWDQVLATLEDPTADPVYFTRDEYNDYYPATADDEGEIFYEERVVLADDAGNQLFTVLVTLLMSEF